MKRKLGYMLVVALVIVGCFSPTIQVALKNRWIVTIPNIFHSVPKGDVPSDYYDQKCIIPWGMSVETWLTETTWRMPYEQGEWDCSRMSAFTEWALENCGYSAEIVLVWSLRAKEGHAFVRVKLDDGWREYEATGRHWPPEDAYDLMRQRLVFASIHSASYFFERAPEIFDQEFRWWGRIK